LPLAKTAPPKTQVKTALGGQELKDIQEAKYKTIVGNCIVSKDLHGKVKRMTRKLGVKK